MSTCRRRHIGLEHERSSSNRIPEPGIRFTVVGGDCSTLWDHCRAISRSSRIAERLLNAIAASAVVLTLFDCSQVRSQYSRISWTSILIRSFPLGGLRSLHAPSDWTTSAIPPGDREPSIDNFTTDVSLYRLDYMSVHSGSEL